MKNRPTEEAVKRLCELFARCMEITNNTKADCFFCYSPHTTSYNVYIHRDGWVDGADGEWVDMLTDITEDNIAATMDKIAEIYRELEVEENV